MFNSGSYLFEKKKKLTTIGGRDRGRKTVKGITWTFGSSPFLSFHCGNLPPNAPDIPSRRITFPFSVCFMILKTALVEWLKATRGAERYLQVHLVLGFLNLFFFYFSHSFNESTLKFSTDGSPYRKLKGDQKKKKKKRGKRIYVVY